MESRLPIQENNMALFEEMYQQISMHESNQQLRKQGYKPLFLASETAKIVIIGQAPGKKAQESGVVWNDNSGVTLIKWLGITEEAFRDPSLIAHLPMDFYYPGKGKSGDLPPRKDFARLWHHQLLSKMPDVRMILLIGSYAQHFYLADKRKKNLTQTVRHFQNYLPSFFPLVHPSLLNFRWQKNNPWFASDVLPILRQRIKRIIPKE